MRSITMLLLCSIFTFWAQAQNEETELYSIIEENIQVDSTSLFYPTLLEQFRDSATFMTSEEMLHLYYGWVFQENYSPIMNHMLLDSLNDLMIFDETDTADYDLMEKLCVQILQDEPLNITVIRKCIFVASALQKLDEKEKLESQLQVLIQAIKESKYDKDGKRTYMVTHADHIDHFNATQVWGNLGESMLMGREKSAKVDIHGEQKWIYFNIGPALDYLSEM